MSEWDDICREGELERLDRSEVAFRDEMREVRNNITENFVEAWMHYLQEDPRWKNRLQYALVNFQIRREHIKRLGVKSS